MCNLYSLVSSPDEIRRTFAIVDDRTGNLPPMPGIFPDQMAPVVQHNEAGRTLTMMRWGFPPPPKAGTQPVTNVRNVASPYWRPWLKPEFRCLVPASSFSEYADTRPARRRCGSRSTRTGRCSPLRGSGGPGGGVRGPKRDEPVEEEHRLFSFLTTEANGVVGPVHPKRCRCCSPPRRSGGRG